MKSGNIINNTATKKGGGICLGADGKDIVNVEIIAGCIANNHASVGGGIYIAHKTTLTLKAAAISDNLSKSSGDNGGLPPWMGAFNPSGGQGGGVWFCNTGAGIFHATAGGYISNNQANKSGDDFNAQLANRLDPHLVTRLYDGREIKWFLDGKSGEWSGPRYTADSESITDFETLISRWSGDLFDNKDWDDLALHSETEGDSNDNYYTLRIMKNDAKEGGGIACNGSLIMGENRDISLTIIKEIGRAHV